MGKLPNSCSNAPMSLCVRPKRREAPVPCFDETMRLDQLYKRKLEDALQGALAQNQFTLHFQKQIHVPSGEVKGYEALLRWQQPDGVYIPPSEWIPLAEETGLIVPIGYWVLQTACHTAKSGRLPPRCLLQYPSISQRFS